MKLKELKMKEFFTKKKISYPSDNQVWIKDSYDRSTDKYVIVRCSDINDTQLVDGNKQVFTDFIY